jgi:cell division control protein 6
LGLHEGVLSSKAMERIVDLTHEGADLRLGLYLLKLSALEAEKRASRKIEIEDVEKVCESGKKIFLKKLISALGRDERLLLEQIYSTKEITSGELFKEFGEKLKIGYTKFYEMLTKLESIKLIDTRFDRKKRGRTRVILKRYDAEMVLNALREFK